MKALITSAIFATGMLTSAHAQQGNTPNYTSLKLEIENGIKTGNAYIKSKQDAKGFWKDDTIPAYTGLAITAAMRDPNREGTPEHIKKAYTWLLSKQKDSGAIYGKGLATYNTSISVMALCASGEKAHHKNILAARTFLISMQQDHEGNKLMNKHHGGVGYGSSDPHSNLSVSYMAMEAIVTANIIARDSGEGKEDELDWESAMKFVSRCQNLEKTNDQPGIANDGSFNYDAASSKAGEKELPDGRKVKRGYGSMSYAGLLSMIYAELDQDDPRVVAVKKWLNENFTLEENPGVGQQGLYYYYNVMAKALTAANIDTLTTKDGKKIDWRKALAERILSKQREDGSWVNENSRWWENQPELVTPYAVITLEQIHASMPQPAKPTK